MRVSAVDNTHFGMAVKTTPKAKQMLDYGLTERAARKFEELKKVAEKDSVDVNIGTEEIKLGGVPPKIIYTRLIVDVGDGAQYSYRPFLSVIRTIRKAVKKAHELSEAQKITNNI